ncbi:MAG TPA: 30S ribosomal protein S3 [Candidatus Paceibacterota bacterium]|nr:30S ribosomal protein S3 [Candidatus Paceibacterota bacterium]
MGQKVSPTGFRVGIIKDWSSKWFGGSNYPAYLKTDITIRDFLTKRLRGMAVDSVGIERGPKSVKVVINTARPGLIIGRGGSGIEDIKKQLNALLGKKVPLQVEVQELRNPESSAAVAAESLAEQLEKRFPFRRAMRMTLARLMAARDVKGAKIHVGGRLDGSEIARSEHQEEGSLPLQTLRADIDFARATAYTTYGTIGIKVWVYKGEVFDEDKDSATDNLNR